MTYKIIDKSIIKIIPNMSSTNKVDSGATIKGKRQIVTRLLLLLNSGFCLLINLYIKECKCFVSAINGLLFSTSFFLINENRSSMDG